MDKLNITISLLAASSVPIPLLLIFGAIAIAISLSILYAIIRVAVASGIKRGFSQIKMKQNENNSFDFEIKPECITSSDEQFLIKIKSPEKKK